LLVSGTVKMLGSNLYVLIFSSVVLGASAAETITKFTALKFGTDRNDVISYHPDMSPLVEKFSCCVWFKKLRSVSNSKPIVFAYDLNQLFLYDNYGNYRFFGTVRALWKQITIGQWNQFCVTWSFATRTVKAYINGTIVDSFGTGPNPPDNKLKTGGTLVLGNYVKGDGALFGGEMLNFNMFSKELTSEEVASLSADGLCTLIPEDLENYRVIKWEDILKLDRSGNVQDKIIECQSNCIKELSEVQAKLQEAERKLLVKERELNTTKVKLEKADVELNKTKAELNGTKEELNKNKAELNGTKEELNETKAELNETMGELEDKNTELEKTNQELKRLKENKLEKGNLTKWDVFYSSDYHNKIFTLQLYEQLQTMWESLTKSLLDIRMTDEAIELLKKLENVCQIS